MEQNKEKDIQNNSIIDNKYIIIKKIDEGGFAKIYLTKKKELKNNTLQKYSKKGGHQKQTFAHF